MKKDDVLRVAGEPVGIVRISSQGSPIPKWIISADQSHLKNGDTLYTQYQLLAVAKAIAEDMREWAINEAYDDGARSPIDRIRERIRALPITTNTEGEQG